MNLKRLLRSLATALAGTLVVFAIVIGAGLMLSGSSPDLSYRTLDYDVAVQADGSLKVTQHIDMKLRARATAIRHGGSCTRSTRCERTA